MREQHGECHGEGVREQNREKDSGGRVQREGVRGGERSCMYEEQQRSCPMYLVAVGHSISEESGGREDVSLFWNCAKNTWCVCEGVEVKGRSEEEF